MDPNTSSSSPSAEVSYLMNSCGLSEEKALTASTKLKFSTKSNPDSVLNLLKSYGFTEPDITKIISNRPRLLLCYVSILKSKLDYFFSKQISDIEVIKFLCIRPYLLIYRLENKIITLFDYIKNIVGTDSCVLRVLLQMFPKVYLGYFSKMVDGNFQVLKDEGVPEISIVNYFRSRPRVFQVENDRFKEAVQEVKRRGLNPCEYKFLNTVRFFVSGTDWEEKMKDYKRWGWTDEELEILCKKDPKLYFISAKKINAVMEYLVTDMGYSLSDFRRNPSIFRFSLEKTIIPRLAVYRYLISIHFIEPCNLYTLVASSEDAFLKKFVIEYEEEVPEVWQIFKEAFKKSVMEEGVQGSAVKNAEVDKSQEEEEIAAVPLDEKVLEDSQASVLKKKVDSDKVEELKKAKRPKKVLKKSKKKVEEVQSSAAKKGEEDKSNEEEEIDDALVLEKVVQDSQASVIDRKVASNKVGESKKAKGPKKVLNKKLKKTVEAVQGGGKKEGEDKAKEEEEISAVSMVGKVLEVTQSSVLKRKIGLDKEEELKKAKRFKKVLKKSSKKVEEVQSSAAKKGEEDKSNEEEEIDDALVLEKVVQDSQASVIERKVASHKVEESKKAKGPKKVLNKKLKKTVEAVQGGGKKEGEDKAKEEEEISAVSMVGKVLEVTQSSVLKRKIGLDKEEELKKAKRFKKVLKKSSKKKEEVQSSAAKKGEEDKSNEEEEIDDALVLEKVVQDSQASVIERKVASHKVEESKKAKGPKKVLNKKLKKTVEAVQGGGKKEGEDKAKEEEEISAVSMVGKVLEVTQSSVLKRKIGLDKEEELKKAKRFKKVLKKSSKKVEEVQSSAAKKGEEDKSNEEEEIDDALVLEKVVQDSQASVIEWKVASHKVEESKKAKGPKKVLNKKLKKTVEAVQGGGKKEGEDKAKEEEEISAVSVVGKVLEVTQSSVLKRKIGLDKEEELKKSKRFKKVLKKSSKKAEEVQSSAAKKYDVEVPELLQASIRPVTEDSQNEEVTFCPERATESVAALPKVAKVVNKSEVGEPTKKASSSDLVHQKEKLEEEELKKAKRPKKILKKIKKKVEVVQGSGAQKEGGDKSEVEDIVAVSMVEEILEDSYGSLLKRKLVLDTVEEPQKTKRPKKLLKKLKKKVEEVQGSAPKQEEEDKSEV